MNNSTLSNEKNGENEKLMSGQNQSRDRLNTLTLKDREFSPNIKVNRHDGNDPTILSLEVSNTNDLLRQSADTELRKNTTLFKENQLKQGQKSTNTVVP